MLSRARGLTGWAQTPLGTSNSTSSPSLLLILWRRLREDTVTHTYNGHTHYTHILHTHYTHYLHTHYTHILWRRLQEDTVNCRYMLPPSLTTRKALQGVHLNGRKADTQVRIVYG